MRPSDDALIALLREALENDHSAPSPESVAQLRGAVTDRFAGGTAIVRRGRARLAAATSVFLVVSGSMAGAVASGATLPASLRVLARDVGLPVDSVGLARAKADAGRLRQALASKDAAVIPRDVSALKTSFSGLDPSDRRSIDTEVDSLIDQAGSYDDHAEDDTESPPTATNQSGARSSGTAPLKPADNNAGEGGPTSPGTTLAPGTDGNDGDESGDTTVAGGSPSTTASTAPPSDSGNTSPTPTTTDTSDGGGGSSDGGSSVQSDGGGH